MGPGIWQILIIVLVVLLLFGAGRLPRVMEDLAKGIKSFKKGLQDEEPAKPAVTDKSEKPAVTDKSEKPAVTEKSEKPDNY